MRNLIGHILKHISGQPHAHAYRHPPIEFNGDTIVDFNTNKHTIVNVHEHPDGDANRDALADIDANAHVTHGQPQPSR